MTHVGRGLGGTEEADVATCPAGLMASDTDLRAGLPAGRDYRMPVSKVVSRRTVLTAAGPLGVGALLAACTSPSASPSASTASSSLSASPSGSGGPRVLVIGAGAAGLAAAGRLAAAGVRVTVLEARDRVGGRIHTTTTWPDLPIDLGASWIHGHLGNPLTPLAEAAGAPTVATSYDSARSYVAAALRANGLTDPDTARWERLTEQALVAAAEREADVSVATALAGMPWYPRLSSNERADLDFYLASTYDTEWGVDSSDLSAWTSDEGREFAGEDRLFPQGFGAVAAHLATGLDIRLSSPVGRIHATGATADGVLVTGDGIQERADAVIVTVPLGVLKSGALSIEPGLSARAQRAVQRLGVGVLSKTFLRFEKLFWPKDIDWHEYVGEQAGHWAEWVSFAKAGVPVMLGFNSGANARRIEAVTDADVVAEAMAVLREMFGAGAPSPVAVQTSQWSRDPFALGSYSANTVGSNREDRVALAEPIADRIFWAGEATEPDYHSTVHGAVLSGHRAAEAVRARLSAG